MTVCEPWFETMRDLRDELNSAVYQLTEAFEAMEFDPNESVEGVDQMRLAAAQHHLLGAKRLVALLQQRGPG